jgi:hypothetical protein
MFFITFIPNFLQQYIRLKLRLYKKLKSKLKFFIIFSMQKIRRKGRWIRRTLRILLALIIFFITACFVFDHYVQFRKSDDELNKFFTENHIPGKIGYYVTHGRRLRYVSIGSDSLPTLVFIHGSPASMSLYRGRFNDNIILKTFRNISRRSPGLWLFRIRRSRTIYPKAI